MQRERRAIVFDLDDTLYPLDHFVLSGFDAVATRLEERFLIPRATSRMVLRQAFHNGGRGRELQICLQHFGLPEELTSSLVEIIRRHRPEIDLPELSARALATLAPHWRLGIITNGPADIQARKIAALGLSDRVDAIVFAHGATAKPCATPFLEVTRRLKVPLRRSIFVGNDPLCDVYGAWRLGMKTIHVTGAAAACRAINADAAVRSLIEVPDIAERLVA